MIYLDAASTTKPKQKVIDAMMPYFTEKWYNPSSIYSAGATIKKDIENARKTIGDFINANSNEIYFTSGGSESNCWAIQGFVNHCNRKGKDVAIITSVIEHKSIMDCVDNMNVNVHYVGVNNEGFVNVKSLESLLQDANSEAHEIIVSIQFANNEIGTIQNIKEIATLVHKYDAVFHTDAVQAFGQIPIDVKDLDIDMLSASGHKIGTPKGIGFLYIKDSVEIDPLVYGSQMDGMRGGTENVPYIIGMAKAVEISDDGWEGAFLRDYMIEKLKLKFDCNVNGSKVNRLRNNINITFPQKITGEALVYLLDLSDIYLSTGSACNSHSVEPSHVLKAIGLSDEEAARTIRITLSDMIDYDMVDKVIQEIEKQVYLFRGEWQ